MSGLLIYGKKAVSEIFKPIIAVELVLKAFLLVKGVANTDLKKRSLGHDLSKILLKAKALDTSTKAMKDNRVLTHAMDRYIPAAKQEIEISRVKIFRVIAPKYD